jgi:hypothetical protein
VRNIRHEIPEYRGDPSGPVTADLRTAVHTALRMFIRINVGGGDPLAGEIEVFRRLGRIEAQMGRTHDTLQAAYRIAMDAVLQQILVWERQFRVSREFVAGLSAATSRFLADVARYSAEGFDEVRGHEESQGALASDLIASLVRRGGAAPATVSAHAERLGWDIPAECAVGEVLGAAVYTSDALNELARSIFGPTALAGSVGGRQLVLLSDGADVEAVRTRLSAETSGVWVFLGPRGPLSMAPASARLARQASDLPDSRLLADRGLMLCEDHLLVLLADVGSDAVDCLARRRLAPLLRMTPAKRVKYGRLLSALLEFGGTHGDAPGILDQSRQTLRYQIRRLEDVLGEQLRDRDARVELILALRVTLPGWEREAEWASRHSRSARPREA